MGDQDTKPTSVLPSTSGFTALPGGAKVGAVGAVGVEGVEGAAGVEEVEGVRDPPIAYAPVYSFHWYVPPCSSNLTEYLDGRLADAKRLSSVPFASEFNVYASDDASRVAMAGVFGEFEARAVGYTGWQYKSYSGSLANGTCTGCGNSFFFNNGSLNTFTAASIARPFAQYIAGTDVTLEGTGGEGDDILPYALSYTCVGGGGDRSGSDSDNASDSDSDSGSGNRLRVSGPPGPPGPQGLTEIVVPDLWGTDMNITVVGGTMTQSYTPGRVIDGWSGVVNIGGITRLLIACGGGGGADEVGGGVEGGDPPTTQVSVTIARLPQN